MRTCAERRFSHVHNEMVARAAISRPKTWAHAHAALPEGATTVTTKSTKTAKTTKTTKKPAVKKAVAKKAPAKKAPAKKAPAKKAPAKKAPAKKVAAKKAPAKKAAIKKPVVKKAPAKKAPAKKAPAKKAPAKKVAAKKAPVKKAAAKKAPAKKAPVKKAPAKKAPAKKAPVQKVAPKKVAAQKPAEKKAASAKATSKKAAAVASGAEGVAEVVEAHPAPVIKKFGNVVEMPKKKAKPVPGITKVISPGPQIGPKVLVVREDESPWTKAELKQIRAALHQDESRLLEEIDTAEIGLADLIRDSGDGAGDDQADAGSKTFEREHEMSLANNAREMLLQVRHALGRIDDGSYGVCEGCGNAVGKLRLQAFPRATLCMACKVAEERY
jgi:RNA polymerase-binding protein DksA